MVEAGAISGRLLCQPDNSVEFSAILVDWDRDAVFREAWAKLADVPAVYRVSRTDGTLKGYVTRGGDDGITVELCGIDRIDEGAVVDGVESLLSTYEEAKRSELGIGSRRQTTLPYEEEIESFMKRVLPLVSILAPYRGFIHAEAGVGDVVRVGDVLGRITDAIGTPEGTLYSTVDGFIVTGPGYGYVDFGDECYSIQPTPREVSS